MTDCSLYVPRGQGAAEFLGSAHGDKLCPGGCDMAETDQNDRLTEVYVTKSLQGRIIAFARCADDVRVFRPDNTYDKVTAITHKKWEEHKISYGDRSDVSLYSDTVNAAWQQVGWNDSFDRAAAKQIKLPIGHYFPRIWRGIYDLPNYYKYNSVNPRKSYGNTYISSNVAVSNIFDALELLFRYVEPTSQNHSTFGHKIREALILTCTEVETAWRSVLEANSSEKKHAYKTKDYFVLLEPMQLNEWSVMLRDYPDMGVFSPFNSWEQSCPTKSLPWYDAYNAVKHHREERFSSATLGNLVDAAASLHIMQCAQFGPEMYHRMLGNERSPFHTIKHPVYDLSDIYISDFINDTEMIASKFFK
jgi:hypothetical protein